MDADWLLQDLDARGAATVIPSKANRKQRDYDREACKWQHPVEDYVSKPIEFRGLEARYDKIGRQLYRVVGPRSHIDRFRVIVHGYSASAAEQEMQDIAVLHDVALAFSA